MTTYGATGQHSHRGDYWAGFSFDVGERFSAGDVTFEVEERRGQLVVLKNVQTLQKRAEIESVLALRHSAGLLIHLPKDSTQNHWAGDHTQIEPGSIAIPLIDASYATQLRFDVIIDLITQLRFLGHGCLRPRASLQVDYHRSVEDLRQRLPHAQIPTLATVYAWSLKLDRANGDQRALVPRFSDQGGRNRLRISPLGKTALAQSIELLRKDRTLKLRPVELERQVMRYLIGAVGQEAAEVTAPSRSTCARVLQQEFTQYQVILRNKGRDAADRFFRTWYQRDAALLPLEVVEFDDKDSRVFLIDEETNLPCGRAHVTSGVDQATEMPMGFSISDRPRSTWSALQCFTNVVVPKDMTRDEFSLVQRFDLPWGKPAIALFDNATYNHSSDISISCREANAIPAWAKPYTPTEKSAVENFNGMMDRGFFSTLDGYGGEKSTKAGLNDGLESAVVHMGFFRRALMKWVYGVHANDPGESGISRWDCWRKEMEGVRRRYPLDIFRLRLSPTLRHTVKLRPEGVRFTGLFYQNDRLRKLQRDIGYRADIVFRYNPEDMSRVYVFDPNMRVYFEVASMDPAYTTGLTLYQHRLIRKMCRIRGKRNPSLAEMLAEREELRKLVAQNKRSTKLRERRQARRTGEPGQPAANPSPEKAPDKATVVVTELEDRMLDISDVPMEEEEEGWEVPELV